MRSVVDEDDAILDDHVVRREHDAIVGEVLVGLEIERPTVPRRGNGPLGDEFLLDALAGRDALADDLPRDGSLAAGPLSEEAAAKQ